MGLAVIRNVAGVYHVNDMILPGSEISLHALRRNAAKQQISEHHSVAEEPCMKGNFASDGVYISAEIGFRSLNSSGQHCR